MSSFIARQLKIIAKKLVFLLFVLLFTFMGACSSVEQDGQDKIKVGILHSLSGTMALSERPVVDATLMAIDEINMTGGLLGKQIEPIVVDTQSDPIFAAEKAEDLIFEEGVEVIFGCWTSDCRRWVKPVIEGQDSLLFYPVQFEGLEESRNIIYMGATPNQQMLPIIEWAFKNIGPRFYLVGSDYVFPRAANEVIRDHLALLGGEIVGEQYRPLGNSDFSSIAAEIALKQPDVILNTVNGDSNLALFSSLRLAGITPEDIPTISFSIAEEELSMMPVEDMVGDFAAWSYFQNYEGSVNQDFIDRFKEKYGQERVTSDPMVTAYTGVFLWAQAVEAAQTTVSGLVREKISEQNLLAPQGWIRVDADNFHTWKHIRLGQVNGQGQFDVVWETGVDIRPEPFPGTRTKADWQAFLNNLD